MHNVLWRICLITNELLLLRFSSVASAEQYRVELGRLRRGNISPQELHSEVRRLVNEAFLGYWSKSTVIYAPDAMFTALNDAELRKQILIAISPLQTLANTHELAVRAVTIDDGGNSGANVETFWKQTYRVCFLAETKPTAREIQLH
jgi:hypothetical protein